MNNGMLEIADVFSSGATHNTYLQLVLSSEFDSKSWEGLLGNQLG